MYVHIHKHTYSDAQTDARLTCQLAHMKNICQLLTSSKAVLDKAKSSTWFLALANSAKNTEHTKHHNNKVNSGDKHGAEGHRTVRRATDLTEALRLVGRRERMAYSPKYAPFSNSHSV